MQGDLSSQAKTCGSPFNSTSTGLRACTLFHTSPVRMRVAEAATQITSVRVCEPSAAAASLRAAAPTGRSASWPRTNEILLTAAKASPTAPAWSGATRTLRYRQELTGSHVSNHYSLPDDKGSQFRCSVGRTYPRSVPASL